MEPIDPRPTGSRSYSTRPAGKGVAMASTTPSRARLLNTREASDYLNGLYAPATLETMRTRGGGPPFRKIGGRVFYLPQDLDGWLAEARPLRSTADYEAGGG